MLQLIEDNQYLYRLTAILEAIEQDEMGSIRKAAKPIYKSIKKGGVLHVFATGHSHMVADELFYRAGGLAPVSPLLVNQMMVYEGAMKSTLFEREPGNATALIEQFDVRKGDCMLLSSNSGINIAPIEAAIYARTHGLTTICITSKDASRQLVSRHPNGKRLYEVCDIVLDSHTPMGDGLLHIPSSGQPTGSVSSFSALYIAQRIVLCVENLFLKDGAMPPIFQSANTPGGDEFNPKIIEQYKGRIPALQK